MDGCVLEGEGESPVEAAEEPLPTDCLSLPLLLCCSSALICFILRLSLWPVLLAPPGPGCTKSEAGFPPEVEEHCDAHVSPLRQALLQIGHPQQADARMPGPAARKSPCKEVALLGCQGAGLRLVHLQRHFCCTPPFSFGR